MSQSQKTKAETAELRRRLACLRGDIENLADMIRLENFRDPGGIVSVLRQAIAVDDQATAARSAKPPIGTNLAQPAKARKTTR